MAFSTTLLLSLALSAQPVGAPRLLFAAPLTEHAPRSPRQLFNAALSAEEQSNVTKACQLYLAARLAPRAAFADELYARGAAIRLVRLLAERDEDAAAAAALMVHGTISYKEAMSQSADPEDLSLKLRRMFPNLEQGEEMATSDFAEIQELIQFRKLYEEQEEKAQLRKAESDEEAGRLQGLIQDRDRMIQELQGRIEEMRQEHEKMRADYGRLRDEAQGKIDKLMDRIRELNQRMAGGGGAPGAEKKSGIFR